MDFGETLDIPEGFVMLSSETEVPEDRYAFQNMVTNQWEQGYTGELCLTNVGSTVIEDWYLTFQSEDEIQKIWIGTLTKLENGMY